MCLAHYVSHYNITKSGSLRILYVDDAYFTQGKFYVGVAGVLVETGAEFHICQGCLLPYPAGPKVARYI